MPLSEIISPFPLCSIGVWTITESVEELRQLLAQKSALYKLPENYTHNKRMLEWFAVRLILYEMFEHAMSDEKSAPFRVMGKHSMLSQKYFDITYNENGKPHLKNPEGHISISHTKEIVSVMYHQTNTCGIDIELVKPRILKVAHKFLREDEKEFLTEENYLEKLYIIWGAKEVMYKIYSKGDLDFIEYLKVNAFQFTDSGKVSAQIIKPNENSNYTIYFLRKQNLLITYAVAE